jgi:hypothetical protein
MKNETLQKLGLVADLVELKRLKDIKKGIAEGNQLQAAQLAFQAEKMEDEARQAQLARELAASDARMQHLEDRLERIQEQRRALEEAHRQREHELDVQYRKLCRQATKQAGEDGDYAAILKELVEDTCEDAILERYRNHLAAAEALVAEQEREAARLAAEQKKAAEEAAAEAALTPEQREARDRRRREEAQEAERQRIAAETAAAAARADQLAATRAAEQRARVQNFAILVGALLVVVAIALVIVLAQRHESAEKRAELAASVTDFEKAVAAPGTRPGQPASKGGVVAPVVGGPRTMSVHVVIDRTKPDGTPWDALSDPDIAGTITVGDSSFEIPKCQDVFVCDASFPDVELTPRTRISVELVERDVSSDDPIGSATIRWLGERELSQQVGGARVNLTFAGP